MTVFEFFQKALELEEGERLLIPCLNTSTQESMRVRLYQFRKQAKDDSILVSKTTLEGKPYISLMKVSLHKAFIVKVSGEIVPVEDVRSDEVVETSLKRIVSTARADKYPIEDLLVDLQETFSKSEVEREWTKQEEEMKNA